MKRGIKRKTYTVITKCFDMIGRMGTYEDRRQAEAAMRSRALAVAEAGGLKEICGRRNSYGFYRYDVRDKKSGACLFTARLVANVRQVLLIEEKQITTKLKGEKAMRSEFTLNYVVIMNDGVNAYQAEAGFNNLDEAIAYADKRAGEYEAFNTSDSDSVFNSASVAHYEVVDAINSNDAWETRHETTSFYND